MKKLFTFIFLALALGRASAQTDGYAFLCDSNGYALPGFYVNASNVVGVVPTGNLSTNLVYQTQIVTLSNTLATAAAGQSTAVSNALVLFQTELFGLNNVFTNATTNCFIVAGASNLVSNASPPNDSCVIAGGKTNTIGTSTTAGFIGGGLWNSIAANAVGAIVGSVSCSVNTSTGGFIGGGYVDTIGGQGGASAGGYSVIEGGYTNWIPAGFGNVIAGGWNNTIGQVYGWHGYYDGPLYASWCWAGGVGAWPVHSGCFVWADYQGGTNFLRTSNTNQFLIRAKNGVGINTNNPGPNALEVFGNSDFQSLSIAGVNFTNLVNWQATSNGISALVNYWLNSTSNALESQITSPTVVSNALVAQLNVVSNALQYQIAYVSNQVATAVASKAFSCSVPSTYASIGIGFSTPLMPDGNYSVLLQPQDSTTAGSPESGLHWYVGSKNNNGFTIYLTYATNYNLNFDCIVKENTQ